MEPHVAHFAVADGAAQIVEVAGEAVHRMHQDGVAVPDEADHRVQLGPVLVLPGEPVGEQPVQMNAIQLPTGVLVQGADPGVTHALTADDPAPTPSMCQVEIYDLTRQVSRNAEKDSNLTPNVPDDLTSSWGVPQTDIPRQIFVRCRDVQTKSSTGSCETVAHAPRAASPRCSGNPSRRGRAASLNPLQSYATSSPREHRTSRPLPEASTLL